MNGNVYEENAIVKLFHNKELQKKYLPDMLTGIFTNFDIRKIAFLMVLLYQGKKDITLQNLVMMQSNVKFKAFASKANGAKTDYGNKDVLTEGDIADIVMDISIDSTTEFFDECYKQLHDICFANYVTITNQDFKYEVGYNNPAGIISKAKGIIQIHNALYKVKSKNRVNQIDEAFTKINASSAYLKTSSTRLNFLMGGWSKAYAAAAIGRPSHNKSTWFTFETLYQINVNKLDHVDIIGAEETVEGFWRRVFAIEFGIPVKEMAEGVRRITPEELVLVKRKYDGKIRFHHMRDYFEIASLFDVLKSPFIWIDHVNAIAYPGGDDYKGIKKLIDMEKEWLASNKESVIVNLSQVNTKNMKYQKRLFPSKEDAYMSSVLEQACREFISFYYPYKDFIDPEFQKQFAGKPAPAPELAQIRVEKNSLGDIGTLDFVYEHLIARFSDAPERKNLREVITDEPDLFKDINFFGSSK